MKNSNFLNIILRAGFAISLAFGFVVVSNSSVQAQYGSYGRYGGYGNSTYQIAQQNGYNDGLLKGQEDAREGHNNPTGTSEYRNATRGYSSSMGNKDQYKEAYRQAFLQGFSEGQNRYYGNGGYGNNGGYNNGGYGNNGGYNNGGYNRNGRYGNNGGYGNTTYDINSIAQQNGYNDGLLKGQEDAREGHNNPTGTSEYRNATHGYDSRMGSKEQYRETYRQAFLQGFNDGQNGSRSNRRRH
jgi:hypothetical protein